MSSEGHVSIEGTLLMLDDKIPHVAVPVQAIRDWEVVAIVLGNERGRYQLEPGEYQLRCQVLGEYVYYGSSETSMWHQPGELSSGESRDNRSQIFVK